MQRVYYLRFGAHSEALVPGKAPERIYDNVLLITPNEGLSAQHLAELAASGIPAARFGEGSTAWTPLLEEPLVQVIEIHKLAEEVTGEGVSIPLEAVGQNNLVIVDEGHKGTGSEAQTWKRRQKYLSEGGFLLEYSATFAQAIAAAGKKARKALLHEYGKAILFDYSYAHFYADGYGKDFVVLNLESASAKQAHDLLVGGLLVFYHQYRLYREREDLCRAYNIAQPLWVLLGSSVNALYSRDRQRRSDVAEVVAFLRRFVKDPRWAIRTIERILQGESGFRDSKTGQDLFVAHLPHLRGAHAAEVYRHILEEIFHGSGGLEVWEIKQADGEFGLRLSTADEAAPYFGVINIGDVSAFKKYLSEHLSIKVQEDTFRPSQFDQVEQPNSSIHLLIGAKKFIEGWSSWRVASMGLLNVGKGAGSQIIQLFGRGVRLKGKNMSLKRSTALEGELAPKSLRFLETLHIFGWNANYIHTFRKILEHEGLGEEVLLHTRKFTPWPKQRLPVLERREDFHPSQETWALDADGPEIVLDLTPRLHYAISQKREGTYIAEGTGAYTTTQINWNENSYLAVLDWQTIYLDLLEYKQTQGYNNLYISPEHIRDILISRCRVHILPEERTLEMVQRAASQVLKMYIDRFVRMKEREAESQHAHVTLLADDDPRVLAEYRLRVRDAEILTEIRHLLHDALPALDTNEPLPRLYFDRSLFNPLLIEGNADWKKKVFISPSPLNRDERQFVEDLRTFWATHHDRTPYRDYEIYLLRNLARVGIGLFRRSGFYPDFILWLHNRQTGDTDVIFVEPHGLHHGGLSGNADKFAALKALRNLHLSPPEGHQGAIQFRGYILTTTPLEHISDREGRIQQDLEATYPLIFQGDDKVYIRKVLGI